MRSTSRLEICRVWYRETDYLLYLNSALATASHYAMDRTEDQKSVLRLSGIHSTGVALNIPLLN